jgi:hypothetical protein
MTPTTMLFLASLLASTPGSLQQVGGPPGGPPTRPWASARGSFTWYVAPTGSDADDCASPGSPCATIGAAVGKAADGDVVLVALGTYVGQGVNVVLLDKDLTLSGGWEADFSAQTGRSVVDGESARRVLLVEDETSALLEDFVLENGDSFFGCARNSGGTLVLVRCSIEDNSSLSGGVESFDGSVTLRDSTVRDNHGGPGIRSFRSSIVLEGCTVHDNAGQGLHLLDGSADVSSSVLRDNGGPGIDSNGDVDVVVRDCMVERNRGGLLNFTGTMRVERSTIHANIGGLQNLSGNGRSGRMTLLNTTVSGNTSDFNGGGVFNSGTLELNNCTITANSANGGGGGLFLNFNPGFTFLSIQNTIVAGNPVGGDVGGGFTTYPSGGSNLFGGLGGTIVPADTDLVGLDPRLGPLADHGGPTLTHALLPDSSARDAANPAIPGSGAGACEPFDQRGVPRPIGSRCDIGALEAPTFLVTSTADAGPGSLRQAILDANASPGADSITFAIPGAGPHRIAPLSPLPDVSDPVFVDGFSQPGSSPNTRPFGQGTDAVPMVDLDGGPGLGGPFSDGIVITGGNSTLRGLVIRRVGRRPVVLASDGNAIVGCFIGLDASGAVGSSNGFGIEVLGSDNRIGGLDEGDRNVVSFNNGSGIRVSNDSQRTRILGNFIGTNALGTAARGNQFDGIELGGTGHVVVRNLISGNGRFAGSGIELLASDCFIQENLIGTDVSGTLPLGNNQAGIYIQGSATGNWIGDPFGAPGNVIAFNYDVYDQIGGGVSFGSSSVLSTTNTIARNSIHSNQGLGIDIRPAGVNPNDALDLDTGQNDGQNYPELAWAELDRDTLKILGELNSRPDSTFRVEFFSSSSSDPSGHGEGERFLGSVEATTNGSGKASFDARLFLFPSSERVRPGFVCATATDPDGNTSEFSRCVAASVRGRVR